MVRISTRSACWGADEISFKVGASQSDPQSKPPAPAPCARALVLLLSTRPLLPLENNLYLPLGSLAPQIFKLGILDLVAVDAEALMRRSG
jgi:hypothetical protein